MANECSASKSPSHATRTRARCSPDGFSQSWEGEAPAEPQWPPPTRTEPRPPGSVIRRFSWEGEAPAEPGSSAARTEPRPPEGAHGPAEAPTETPLPTAPAGCFHGRIATTWRPLLPPANPHFAANRFA